MELYLEKIMLKSGKKFIKFKLIFQKYLYLKNDDLKDNYNENFEIIK